MSEILQYLLSANLLLCVVVLYHRAFLSRQRRFTLNRVFLLGGSSLAMLLPLLRVSAPGSNWSGALAPVGGWVRTLPEVLVGANGASPAESLAERVWTDWLAIGYLAVAALLVGLLAWRVLGLATRIAMAPREKRDGYTLVMDVDTQGPASFFGFLFWQKGLEDRDGVILAHERCHIRQLHSLDLIWLEMLVAICWFNPAVYLLRRDLRRCHEFLADDAAARVGGKEALFRQVLARQFGTQKFTIANHFQSQIKARITMLNLKSGHKALVRYLMILPLLAMMFACTSLDRDPATENTALTEKSVSPPATPDATLASAELETVGEMVEPKPLNLMELYQAIGYPEGAKEQKLEGKVIVKVLVDKDGSVAEHELLKKADPILNEAVLEHLYELKFEAGTQDGKPVKVWVTIPFAFKLD